MVVSLRVLKQKSSEAYLGAWQRPVMKFSLQNQLMSFNRLLFSQKTSAIAVQHNPKHASDIFLMIFTAVLLHCLKQTYQIFITAIFQDVSENPILSYDLIALFPSIKIFFTALYVGPNYYHWLCQKFKDFITAAWWKFLQKIGKSTSLR